MTPFWAHCFVLNNQASSVLDWALQTCFETPFPLAMVEILSVVGVVSSKDQF